MNRLHLYRCLSVFSVLCCAPGFTATVYKTVDASGVVSFSDTRPADTALVETMVIEAQAQPSSELTQQRLQEIRETTDRMVAERMAREKHRAELRQFEAQSNVPTPSQDLVEYYDTTTVYTGDYPYTVRRPWWRHNYPEHPTAGPPLRPPAQQPPPGLYPLPGNDYPASLIRKSYDPKVRAAFR